MNEVKDGAPADPKALAPDPPSTENGEEVVVSLPKPEAAKALEEVCGCSFCGDFGGSGSAGF